MPEPATVFERIVCAVDPRARTAEAARRAVWLAGPATELIFLAPGEGGDEERAGAALDSATRLAAERGIAAAAHRLTSRERAGGRDRGERRGGPPRGGRR